MFLTKYKIEVIILHSSVVFTIVVKVSFNDILFQMFIYICGLWVVI